MKEFNQKVRSEKEHLCSLMINPLLFILLIKRFVYKIVIISRLHTLYFLQWHPLVSAFKTEQIKIDFIENINKLSPQEARSNLTECQVSKYSN